MRRLICLIFGFLWIASATIRNQPVGSVDGTVINDAGTPIYRAEVQIRNVMSADVLRTTTDQTGYFLLAEVLPGRYALWAKAEGLGSVWLREILVKAGERTTQDVRFTRRISTLDDCERYTCAP